MKGTVIQVGDGRGFVIATKEARYVVTAAHCLVTEIDFIDGDEASDEAAQNYQKHLSDTFRNAAQGISLRTIRD